MKLLILFMFLYPLQNEKEQKVFWLKSSIYVDDNIQFIMIAAVLSEDYYSIDVTVVSYFQCGN